MTQRMTVSVSDPPVRIALTTESTMCAPTQATAAGKAPAISVNTPSAMVSGRLVVQTSSRARRLKRKTLRMERRSSDMPPEGDFKGGCMRAMIMTARRRKSSAARSQIRAT